MNRIFLLTIATVMTYTQVVSATQRYDLNEEQRIQGVISNKEVNRIQIIGDRIQQVVGLSTEYTVENEPGSGQIFIQSLHEAPEDTAFSIVTEAGRTQDIKLEAKDIPGETIILEGASNGTTGMSYNQGAKHKKHSELVNVIHHAVSMFPEAKDIVGKAGIVDMQRVAQKHTAGYTVAMLQITNNTEAAWHADERAIAATYSDAPMSSIQAVAVEDTSLLPGEKTRAYVVIKK